ncbi:hypothetical protein J4Q44_G00197110 [Coregonus suidteri]|uniref:TSC22 domain family protein 1 n=1 Tax=Coregonus suidteri TaxID=861788 RepID=A0AAN8QNB6_9TELE
MHHPHSAGDSGSVRKMAHPANFPRRGNVSNINTGAGSVPTLSTPTSSAVSKSHVPIEDYQSALLMQSQPPVGSSSPGPQHPPHSLNLHSQPPPQPQPQAPSSGSQLMKKKSGFQITSVTPAQISVSTNNSIAEDTESYDDLDESHTEDLSSSEILDVSLSRANDMAGGARSSSEETLNNFHEADTPGAISPNQPPHSLPQGPQPGGMGNGNVHHYPHHQGQHNHPQQALAQPPSSAPHSTPTPGGAGGALKMPSTMEVPLENVSVGSASVATQPVAAVSLPGMHSSAVVATVSIANPLTSNVCNVNMYSSSNVPVMGGVSTSASSSGGGFPPSVMSSGGGVGGSMGSNFGNTNVNPIQHQSSGTVNSSVTMPSAAASASVVLGPSSGTQGGGAAMPQPGMSSSGMALASVPSSQPAPTPAPATTSSRFRVVKLDSSSEPFKKGRWTCAEYYDKETPASAPAPMSSEATAPSGRVVESMRPCGPESVKGGSEREGTSGSSVTSTLSHYIESVGSGEAGGPPLLQPHPHYQDYANPPQAFQTSHPGFPMGLSHPQSHLLTTVAPSVPASIHQPAPINMAGLQTTIGHPTTPMPQQPLTYAQAASIPAPGSAQGLVGVSQQQMGYALTQQASAPPEVALAHRLSEGGGMPPDYPQPQAGLPQPAVPQTLPGPGQMMGVSQQQVVGSVPQLQPQGLVQQQPQQSSIQASAIGGGLMPQMGPGGVTGFGQQPQGHTLPLDHQHQQQQQSFPSQAQGLATQLSNTFPPNQGCLVSNVLPPNPQSDPQPQNGGGLAQSHPQVSMLQDFSSAQAHTQAVASQASALYASLPSFTTTQLEDAQRLLFQHQSALLAQALPKLAVEGGSATGTGLGLGTESNAAAATAVSALTSSAGLFKAMDSDDDG